MTISSCGNLKPWGLASKKSHHKEDFIHTISFILSSAVYVREHYSSKLQHTPASVECQADFLFNKNVNPQLKTWQYLETITDVSNTARCERLSRIHSGVRFSTLKSLLSHLTYPCAHHCSSNFLEIIPLFIVHHRWFKMKPVKVIIL